MEEQQTFRTH